jgi:short-subunit dehydrogenase
MPLRSEWRIQREGFTFDTVLSILKHTALNPYQTLPLYLATLYTSKGQELALKHPDALKWLKTLMYLGVFQKVKNFLDAGVYNNWRSDTYDWRKEIVVVTGGSDGIGARIVKLLAERNITVVVLDIQGLKYDAPPNVHFFHCDLASSSAIKATAAAIRSHVGDPTILVNNAGFARGKTILETTENDLRLTFDINAKAHYFLAQEFLPSMVQKNHGMIVTVASLAAYVTAPSLVDYSASKAAALSFHEGLTTELITHYKAPRVRTVLLCQGYTRTALFQGFHGGDGFMGYVLDPETVAEAVVRAVLAGRSDHIILPRNNATMSSLKNWPSFMQILFRRDLKKLMAGWHGRQVEQPSEKDGGVSESQTFEKIAK